MNRNFTHRNSSNVQKNETNGMKAIMFAPRERTLDFIRQFARVYQFDPRLGHSLGSFIVN